MPKENLIDPERQITGRRTDALERIGRGLAGAIPESLKELREQHTLLSGGMHDLITYAELDDRGLTTVEERAFGRAKSRCDEIKGMIEAKQNELQDLGRRARARERAYATDEGDGPRLFRRGESIADAVREQRKDDPEDWEKRISLGGWLRARAIGPKTEFERRALAEGGEGAEMVPTILAPQLIDALRTKAVATRAGATVAMLESDSHEWARIDADPDAGWRNEAAAVSEDEPSFSRVTFTARSLAVMCKSSFELLQDADNAASAISTSLTAALATKLDKAVFEGSGTPPEPQGILTHPNVQEADASGNPIADYNHILRSIELLQTANVLVDDGNSWLRFFEKAKPETRGTLACVTSPNVRRQYNGLVTTEGMTLVPPPQVAALLNFTSNQISSDLGPSNNLSWILVADFSEIVIGMRQQIRIEVLKERYADTLEVAFIAHLRADVQLWHPEACVRTIQVGLLP